MMAPLCMLYSLDPFNMIANEALTRIKSPFCMCGVIDIFLGEGWLFRLEFNKVRSKF